MVRSTRKTVPSISAQSSDPSVMFEITPYLVAILFLPLLTAGCATYHFGNQALYRPDVYTVHVPVFESESFRPFLGEWLTEAVAKEIELKTPYKLSRQGTADSVLYGRILGDYKYVLTENINDEPRDIETGVFVEVSWRGRGGELISGPEVFAVAPGLAEVAQAAHFIPEGGMSLATAHQQAIVELSEQVVSIMEVPW